MARPECANPECAAPADVVGTVGDGTYKVMGVPLCHLHAAAEGSRFRQTEVVAR